MTDNHVRSAVFVKIIDGDTFRCRIVLAAKLFPQPQMECHVRVKDWSAAELSEPEGFYMRDQFEVRLTSAKSLTLQITGRSFERIVAAVYLDDVLFSGILKRELTRLRAAQGIGAVR